MVTTSDGIDFFVERHEFGVFRDEDFVDAFEGAGLVDIEVGDTWQGRARTAGTLPPST